MKNVDTIFSIKQPYAFLAVLDPFLKRKQITGPDELLKFLKIGGMRKTPHPQHLSLTDVVHQSYDSLFEEDSKSTFSKRKVGRYEKYRLFNSSLLDLIDNGLFVNSLPVLFPLFTKQVDGSLSSNDPYSNMHLLSSNLLSLLPKFDEEFLSRLKLIYCHPTPYVSEVAWDDKKRLGLRDSNFSNAYSINSAVTSMGLGSLEKFDAVSPKIGNSFVARGAFDTAFVNSSAASNPEIFYNVAIPPGELSADIDWFLKKNRIASALNSHLMAIAYAQVFDEAFTQSLPFLQSLGIDGLYRYMSKGSLTTKFLDLVDRYSDTAVVGVSRESKMPFIGGAQGIFGGNRNVTDGVCDTSSLGRLAGFLDAAESSFTGQYKKSLFSVRKPTRSTVSFAPSKNHPFFLLEENLDASKPTIADMFDDSSFSDSSGKSHIEELDKTLIRNATTFFRYGICAIEPLSVQLHQVDRTIISGYRTLDKSNVLFSEFLHGKKLVFPHQVPGLTSLPGWLGRDIDMLSDFRGSEFSLATNPSITVPWLSHFDSHEEKGESLYVGCSIEKIISNMDWGVKKSILKKIVPTLNSAHKEDFFKFREADTFESHHARKGTAIHALMNEPYPNLAHYDTWKLMGVTPVGRESYTEVSFKKDVTGSLAGDFSVSFHPDLFWFYEKNGVYDVFVGDIKTNRRLSYFEHKYQWQVAMSSWVLGSMLKSAGHKVGHYVNALIKNPFSVGWSEYGSPQAPHDVHRPLMWSPVAVHKPESLIDIVVPAVLDAMVSEKRELSQSGPLFLTYKDSCQDKGLCDKKCYLETQIVCEYVKKNVSGGVSPNKVLSTPLV